MSTSRAYVSPYNMRCAVRCAERRALSACVPGNLRPHAPQTYPGDDGSHVRPPEAQKLSHILSLWKSTIIRDKWCMQSAAQSCRLMPRLEIRSDCSRQHQRIPDTDLHFSRLGGMRTRST